MILVFSDLDGTLEDSRADMADAVLLSREELDLNRGAREDWTAFVNQGMDHLYRNCFAEIISPADLPDSINYQKVAKIYTEFYREYIAIETQLYPGIMEMLTTLDDRAVLALYTNKPQELSRRLLLELKVARYFQFIIGCDTFPESKPSPVPLQTIASEAGFSFQTDSAFYLGDSASDKKAADSFGAKYIWCQWGYEEKAPAGTEFIAKDPRQALEYIL